MRYLPGNKYLRPFVKVLYAFAFIAFVTISQHYINQLWPSQHQEVHSVPSPVPTSAALTPTPTPKPLTLKERFQPFAIKICSSMAHDGGLNPPSDVVQRVEILDGNTTADVYCMRNSDHNINGPYEIGL